MMQFDVCRSRAYTRSLMGKRKKQRTVEEVFPSARARQAADDAIDGLDPKEPMCVFLDTWETAYFRAAGKSPFRETKSKGKS